ncbi:tRNA (guanine-N(7)-)-methyltransferase non-catalytic subunit wuho [Brevipalpus obovatus]|uniref:tRNA (guanine-N(7)-)-methyltransferase non-catalytic subunit wuho n=1 Tax=Brevipalpus obovatus TaxID=246614 RepID=UPI003D9EFC80
MTNTCDWNFLPLFFSSISILLSFSLFCQFIVICVICVICGRVRIQVIHSSSSSAILIIMIAFGKKCFITFTDVSESPTLYCDDGTCNALPFNVSQLVINCGVIKDNKKPTNKINTSHDGDGQVQDENEGEDRPDNIRSSDEKVAVDDDGVDGMSKSMQDFGIVCVKLSPSESLLAICHSSKKLFILNTSNWTMTKVLSVSRKLTHILFTSDERYLISNTRSGDVVKYDLMDNQCTQGTYLLGHNSIILDILLHPKERYLLTCDRDEKIRVSNYPNCYNIHQYCLGHSEFVSCLNFLNDDILISGGGDGTLRLWKFIDGVELCSYDCNQNVKLEMGRKLSIHRIHPIHCHQLIAVTYHDQSIVNIHSYDLDKRIIRFESTITFHGKVLHSHSMDGYILLFLNNPINFVNCLDIRNNVPTITMGAQWASSLNENSKFIEGFINLIEPESNTQWLYKRYFDNLNDYLRRKKERKGEDITKKRKLSE